MACINENNELYWHCLVALWMFLPPILGQTVQERSSRIFIRHRLWLSSWDHLVSLHVTKFPRHSPSTFAYWQPSNSGGNEALRTRLLVSEQSFLWVQPHYVGMFNKALLHKHFPVTAYFSKLLAHFNTLACIVAGIIIIIYVTWTTLSLWDANTLVYTALFQGPTQFSVACRCSELGYMLHIARVNNSVNEFYCSCACSVFYILLCVCVLAECANMPRICTTWAYKYMHTRNTIRWMLLSNKLLNLDNRLRGTVMGVVLGVTFSK